MIFVKKNNKIYFRNFNLDPPLSSLFEVVEENKKIRLKLNYQQELDPNPSYFNFLGRVNDFDLVYHVYDNYNKGEKIYYIELPRCKELPSLTLYTTSRYDFYQREKLYTQTLKIFIKNEIEAPQGYKRLEGMKMIDREMKLLVLDEIPCYCYVYVLDQTFH